MVKNYSRGFTLVELLVVIGVLSILSVATVIVLNPSEMIKASRDSTRISDAASLNNALALYSTYRQGAFMGNANVIYTSLPDSNSTCTSWNLPQISGYTYNCVTSSTLTKTNGTGWLPLNLDGMQGGSPVQKLPVDPVNAATGGLYYTYTTTSSISQFEITQVLESQKQATKMATDGGIGVKVYEVGSSFSIAPTKLLMRAVTYGTTWVANLTNQNWQDVAISSNDGKMQTVVAWNGHLWSSQDTGTTWTDQSSLGNQYWISVAMSADGKYQTAVTWSGGIYYSTNYGVTWVYNNTVSAVWLKKIAMSADGKYQTAVVANGKIWISSDYGAHWANPTTYPSANIWWSTVSMSGSGQVQAVGTGNGTTPINLCTSSNYGVDWSCNSSYSSDNFQHVSVSYDGSQISAGSTSNMYKFTGGTSWSVMRSGGGYPIMMSSNGAVRASDCGGMLYLSTDSGVTWSSMNMSNLQPYEFGISSDGSIMTVIKLISGSQLYVSTDTGLTWTARGPSGTQWQKAVMTSDGTVQVAIDYGGKVYVSTQ